MRDDAPVVFICGKRGHGKSTRLRARIWNAPRVVAWDPHCNRRRPRGQLELEHRFFDAEEAAAWIRANPAPHVLRVALHSWDPDDFGILAEALLDSGGDAILAVDEAQTLNDSEWWEWMLANGRHFGIEIDCSARRPAEVVRLATSQAEIVEAFRTDEEADLRALRGRFGSRTNGLARLPKFEFDSTEDS